MRQIAHSQIGQLSFEESKGLNLFVGKFSLPVLIFVSLAGLYFDNIEWSYLVPNTISKSIVAVGVWNGTPNS